MDELLKKEMVDVINREVRKGDAPFWAGTPVILSENIAEECFDVCDASEDEETIKRACGEGNASYFNTKHSNLHFVRFEHYLNQFDEILPTHTLRADLLAYDNDVTKQYFIIHELSGGAIKNKRKRGQNQLFSTLNLLYKSQGIKEFINAFGTKWCVLSADDGSVPSPFNMAGGFMKIYDTLPDPIPIQDKRFVNKGFEAFETKKLKLE